MLSEVQTDLKSSKCKILLSCNFCILVIVIVVFVNVCLLLLLCHPHADHSELRLRLWILSFHLLGMSGFVAELVIFFGIITSPQYLLIPKIVITFVVAIGMILTPIYSLSMLRQMFYGYKLFN